MNQVAFALAVVFGLMLGENRISRLHERRLRASGAIEPPGDVFRALAVLYPAAFVCMGIEGVWRVLHETPTVGGPSWAASGVVLFAASKALKYWAIRSLGERWSFRVLIQPGRSLVTDGPYRYVAHPNYIAVMGELVGTAMMVGAPVAGLVMTVAFAAVLRLRIKFEEQVLAGVRSVSQPTGSDR